MSPESYFRFYPKDIEHHGERVDLVPDGPASAHDVASAYNDLRTRWRHVYIYSPNPKAWRLTRPRGTFLVGMTINLGDNEISGLGYARDKTLAKYRERQQLQQSNSPHSL